MPLITINYLAKYIEQHKGMVMKDKIERELFINGVFSRQRACSAANIALISELEALVGRHKSVSETVFLGYGGLPNTCACGTPTGFISFPKGYREYCSTDCASTSASVKAKRAVKIKQTCLIKYGVDNVMKTAKVKQKIADTMISRYGVPNFSQSGLHQEMVRETSMLKYGVHHVLASEDVKNKIKSTMLKRHGGFTTSSQTLSSKMRDTMVAKYGAETSWHSSLLPKLHAIQRAKFIDRVRENGFLVLEEHQAFLNVQHTCGHQFHLNLFERLGCPGCKVASIPEQELFLFIHSLGVQPKRNDRVALGGKELDIFVPTHSIAFEMNGAYWHHDQTDKLPLLNKTEMAAKHGILLVHIWDFEWLEKKQVVQALIRSKLGLNQKIAARKCEVRAIKKADAKNFLTAFHLQGSCRSSLEVGLYYSGELVGVATAGRTRFGGDQQELLRMCFKPGITVQGGVSKMLSAIPGPLLTYSDRRFGSGGGYLSAGFSKICETVPGYCWYSKGVKYGRYETQRNKLPMLLGNKFDPALTENQNMRNAGFLKLVDCGHSKFIRT